MLRSIKIGFFLAFRTFRRGHKGLLLTPILVMIITYINLLFIPGIIQGAVAANKKIQTVLSADYAVRPSIEQGNIQKTTAKLQSIRKLDGVVAATAVLQVGNKITHGESGGYWTVLAIDPESYRQVFSDKITRGKFITDNAPAQIALGSRIVNDATSGASIQSIGPGAEVNVLTYSGKNAPFKVSGIFDNTFYDADIRGFVSYKQYAKLDPVNTEQASAIFIKAKDHQLSEQTLAELQEIVGESQVHSSADSSASFEEQAGAYKDIGKIIAGMAVIVAAIVIFIVTYIDLAQRRRQIGIQRAIGIQHAAVMTSYLVRALVTTLIGVVVGGLIYRYMIVTYSKVHPFVLQSGEVSLYTSWSLYMWFAVFLMGVAVVSALLPASRELRRSLLDAIWNTR